MESWFSYCTFLSKPLIIQGTRVPWGFLGRVFKRLRKIKDAVIGQTIQWWEDFLLLQNLLVAGFHHILGQQEAFEAFRLLQRVGTFVSLQSQWLEMRRLARWCLTVVLGSVLWHVAVPRAPWVPLCPSVTQGWNSGRFCPKFYGRKLGLKGWRRAMRDWDVFLPLDSGRMTSLLIETVFVDEALSYPVFFTSFSIAERDSG